MDTDQCTVCYRFSIPRPPYGIGTPPDFLFENSPVIPAFHRVATVRPPCKIATRSVFPTGLVAPAPNFRVATRRNYVRHSSTPPCRGIQALGGQSTGKHLPQSWLPRQKATSLQFNPARPAFRRTERFFARPIRLGGAATPLPPRCRPWPTSKCNGSSLTNRFPANSPRRWPT